MINIVCKIMKDSLCYIYMIYRLNVLWFSIRCIFYLYVYVNCCYNIVIIGIYIEFFKYYLNSKFKFSLFI